MKTRLTIAGIVVLMAVLVQGQRICSTPPVPIPVEVDAVVNCGSNPEEVAIPIELEQSGTYAITATGGAWSAWSSLPMWLYRMEIMIGETGEIVVLGDGEEIYETPEEAEAANVGKSVEVHLNEPGTLLFWVNDTPCNDNRGGMMAEITSTSLF